MTLFEANNKLIEFFGKHDSFTMEKNYKDLLLISEDAEADKATVLAALGKLVEMGLLAKSASSGTDYWILVKPLAMYSQMVELSATTIGALTTLVNTLCETSGLQLMQVDGTNVKEKDIVALLMICNELAKRTEQFPQDESDSHQ